MAARAGAPLRESEARAARKNDYESQHARTTAALLDGIHTDVR
jgi:hypothetical protein